MGFGAALGAAAPLVAKAGVSAGAGATSGLSGLTALGLGSAGPAAASGGILSGVGSTVTGGFSAIKNTGFFQGLDSLFDTSFGQGFLKTGGQAAALGLVQSALQGPETAARLTAAREQPFLQNLAALGAYPTSLGLDSGDLAMIGQGRELQGEVSALQNMAAILGLPQATQVAGNALSTLAAANTVAPPFPQV